jgi:hypothetical protein
MHYYIIQTVAVTVNQLATRQLEQRRIMVAILAKLGRGSYSKVFVCWE